MSATGSEKQSGKAAKSKTKQPLAPAAALDMVTSALDYARESGLNVKSQDYGNGIIKVLIGPARIEMDGDKQDFVPLESQQDQSKS